jgi:sulfotransferase
MKKKLFFIAGLPRSGSTLLGTLLNQNPLIYTTHSSSFVEILYRTYSIWNDKNFSEDFAGSKMKNMKIPYLQEITQAYFKQQTDKPIVFDKRRHWHSIENIKMFKEIFNQEPKIICPVRNIEEIVASFKNIFLKNKKTLNLESNIFDVPFFHLKETWNSEFKRCLLFVEYNDLVKSTQKTLNKIYDFIGQPYYKHNLNNIISNDPLKEVEKIYGLKGLHNFPKTIKKSITSTTILDAKELKYYSLQNFWRIND